MSDEEPEKKSFFRKHFAAIMLGLCGALGAGIYQGSVSFGSFLIKLNENQATIMRDQKSMMATIEQINQTLDDMEKKDVKGLWGSSAEAKVERASLTERIKSVEKWLMWMKPVVGIGPTPKADTPATVTDDKVEDYMMEQKTKFGKKP